MVNVLGAVAQWEREATAERTSAALQVLKQQGRATGGVAPYGFQFIAGRRAWHQGEQETLAAIIEHRGAGLSWAKVADKLSATGHRTRTGGRWTRQGAHQVHQAREREHGATVRGGARSIRSIIAKRAAAAGVAGRVSTVRAAGRWIQDRRSSSVCVRRHAGLPHGDQPC